MGLAAIRQTGADTQATTNNARGRSKRTVTIHLEGVAQRRGSRVKDGRGGRRGASDIKQHSKSTSVLQKAEATHMFNSERGEREERKGKGRYRKWQRGVTHAQ
jgi:hypothetical protein